MDNKDIFAKVNEDNFLGATLDKESKQFRVYTNDMLINKIRRDSKKVEKSFDLLCENELRELSIKYSKALYIIGDGCIGAANLNDEVGLECRNLLFNAIYSITASIDLLRRGYILQPGMLLRSTIEVFSLISYIKIDEEGFNNYKTGNYDINKLIKYGKKVLPIIGRFQGFLSNQFVHISNLHSEYNNVIEYTEMNEPLRINLDMIRLSIIMIHIISEVVYFDYFEKHRFWKQRTSGEYEFINDNIIKDLGIEPD